MKDISIRNNFENIWERIILSTDIKSLRQLAKIIGKTQPTISAAKAKGKFPAEWAYLVGKKYGLLTEWIMTGEGPQKLNDEGIKPSKYLILNEIEKWLDEQIERNPDRMTWFELNLIDAFPGFKKWKDEREEEKNFTPNRKIA